MKNNNDPSSPQENSNPEKNHWKLGVFYYNPADKRLFPPKRIPAMGWTVNFANPLSIIAMLALVGVVMGIINLLKK